MPFPIVILKIESFHQAIKLFKILLVFADDPVFFRPHSDLITVTNENYVLYESGVVNKSALKNDSSAYVCSASLCATDKEILKWSSYRLW